MSCVLRLLTWEDLYQYEGSIFHFKWAGDLDKSPPCRGHRGTRSHQEQPNRPQTLPSLLLRAPSNYLSSPHGIPIFHHVIIKANDSPSHCCQYIIISCDTLINANSINIINLKRHRLMTDMFEAYFEHGGLRNLDLSL